MLDSVPRKIYFEYWLRRRWHWLQIRRDSLIKFAFNVIPLFVAGLYYHNWHYLTQQEARMIVNISNLTVFYIIFLFYMAHFANRLLTRFTKGKPYIYRMAGLFLFIMALVFILDLIGMEMRW